jgi:hypothetical protein
VTVAPAVVSFASAQALSLKARVERGLQRSDLNSFLDAGKLPGSETEIGMAIFAAGKTGDTFWVPYLRPYLKSVRNRNSNRSQLAGYAQLALAKLGEVEQLQEIACEAEYGYASLQYMVVEHKLKYVGGWFYLNLLGRWLDEPHMVTALVEEPRGDDVYLGHRAYALMELPKIAPNPATGVPPILYLETQAQEKLEPYRQSWREWFRANGESLKSLAPAGTGVDFTVATCKKVLKHDPHFHHF